MKLKPYPRYAMKYDELHQNYHLLRRDYERTQDHLQRQMNIVGDYAEVFDWMKKQPWFDHIAYNQYINSRVAVYVDNSVDESVDNLVE